MESSIEIAEHAYNSLVDSVIDVISLFYKFIPLLPEECIRSDQPENDKCVFKAIESLKLCHKRLKSSIGTEVLEVGNYTRTVGVNYDDIAGFRDVIKGLYNKAASKEKEITVNNMCLALQSVSLDGFKWSFSISESVSFTCNITVDKTLSDLYLQYNVISLLFMSFVELYGANGEIEHSLDNLSCKPIIKSVCQLTNVIYLPICNKKNNIGVDMRLYYDTCSKYYDLNKFPSVSTIMACKLVCKCYGILLKKGRHDFMILPNILFISEAVHNDLTLMGDIYNLIDMLIDVSDDFKNNLKNFAVPLEDIILKRFHDKLNIKCYIRLSILIYKDDVRIYESMESLMDRILMKNDLELIKSFLMNYNFYLESTPLASAATMLQVMELIYRCIGSLKSEYINIALYCLENIFHHLPNDVTCYVTEMQYYFTNLHSLRHSDHIEISEVHEILNKVSVFKNLVVKLNNFNKVNIEYDVKCVDRIYDKIIEISNKDELIELINRINGDLLQYASGTGISANTINFVIDFNNNILQKINRTD